MKSALLVMDIVTSILQMQPDTQNLIPNILQAIDHARANNIPIIFVRLGFRAGQPEISPNNKQFSILKPLLSETKEDKFHPAIQLLSQDIIINKFRIGAFSGNELDILLRTQNIQHLILTGISTSGVVLTTVREAADKDYKLTVLSDACYDRDELVHDCLMQKVFPKQAEVLTTEEWAENLH